MSSQTKLRQVAIRVPDKLMAFITDEDTAVGFLIAGMGDKDFLKDNTNYLIVMPQTSLNEIEAKFKEFVKRSDVAIILISQFIADQIRTTVDAHQVAIPAVLEIPSKEYPYNPEKDSIIKRARRIYQVAKEA